MKLVNSLKQIKVNKNSAVTKWNLSIIIKNKKIWSEKTQKRRFIEAKKRKQIKAVKKWIAFKCKETAVIKSITNYSNQNSTKKNGISTFGKTLFGEIMQQIG